MNQNWHEKFFNKLYLELFMKRTEDEINENIKLISSVVNFNDINSMMDVCCGIGDIAYNIGEKYGVDSFGIEYSNDYVKENLLKNIIQGDARNLQTNKTFDLVISWWSSFAYFSKRDNLRILENCYNYCDKVFLLETANIFQVINKYQPKISYEKMYNNKKYLVDRISNINLQNNTLEQTFIINNSDIYETQSYLYFPKDIVDILTNIGFKDVEVLGLENKKIVQLNYETPRILIRAKK